MDKVYQAMKVIAKSKGVKASPQHDLYKMYSPDFLNVFSTIKVWLLESN